MAPPPRGRDVDWMVRSRRRRIPLAGLGIALVGLLLPACTKPNADERTSQGVVATAFDPIVDFGALSTFATVDSVALDTRFGEEAPSPRHKVSKSSIASRPTWWREGTAVSMRRVARFRDPRRPLLSGQRREHRRTGGVVGRGGLSEPSRVGISDRRVRFGIWICESGVQERDVTIIELVDLRDVAAFNQREALAPSDAGAASDAGAGATRLEIAWGAFLHGYIAVGEGELAPAVLPAIDQAVQQSPYLQTR